MDGNFTSFKSGFSNSVDINDAWKLANPGVNFGILRDGYDLVLERRDLVTTADTTFFRIWNMMQHNYRIMFEPSHFNHPGLNAFLKDTYLNTEAAVRLDNTTYVDFEITADPASAAENRFQLIYTTNATTMVDVAFTGVKAVKQGSNALIGWDVINENHVESYTIESSDDGINFTPAFNQQANNTGADASYEYAYANTSGPYYRIKATITGGRTVYSSVVKLRIPGGPSMIVLSNPVTDKKLNLHFDDIAGGKYSIHLFSANGTRIEIGTMALQAGESNVTVSLPANTQRGIYRVQLVGQDKTRLVKSILVL